MPAVRVNGAACERAPEGVVKLANTSCLRLFVEVSASCAFAVLGVVRILTDALRGHASEKSVEGRLVERRALAIPLMEGC